jgi:hypothetical protein
VVHSQNLEEGVLVNTCSDVTIVYPEPHDYGLSRRYNPLDPTVLYLIHHVSAEAPVNHIQHQKQY